MNDKSYNSTDMTKAITLQTKPHIQSSAATENSTISVVSQLILLFDHRKTILAVSMFPCANRQN